jgi:ribosomal protein S18 acetylase RimI-like enzyme
MSSFRLRELREDDADDVARLFVEAWGDARRLGGDDIGHWFANEALRPENLLVVVDDDDRVVGYFDVWHEEDSVDVDMAAPGLWDETLDLAENRARALGAKRVRMFVADGHDLGDRIGTRGYRPIRASLTMEIEFGVEAPPEPVIPDAIDLRPYRHPDDERAVFEAVEEAFADHWGFHPQSIESWREFTVKAPNFDPDLWLVAWSGLDVAGVVLNYPERAADPGYGWVGALAVRRPWRRRGVGEALLRRSFATFHARGLRKVRLGVDAENPTGATRLYERAGMSVLRRANTWEREL